MPNGAHDPDIERAFQFFMAFMAPGEWKSRKEKIEDSIDRVTMAKYGLVDGLSFSLPLSVSDDKIGWYLYLVETYQEDIAKYEPVQGARVMSIFKRFGQNFDQLLTIGGLKKVVRNLVKNDKSKADATFSNYWQACYGFEMDGKLRLFGKHLNQKCPIYKHGGGATNGTLNASAWQPVQPTMKRSDRSGIRFLVTCRHC